MNRDLYCNHAGSKVEPGSVLLEMRGDTTCTSDY
jgi:hypothetical protein